MYSREKTKKRNLPNETTEISEVCWSSFIWLLVLEIHFGSQPPLIWLLSIFLSIFAASVTTLVAFLHFSSNKFYFKYFFSNIFFRVFFFFKMLPAPNLSLYHLLDLFIIEFPSIKYEHHSIYLFSILYIALNNG